MGVGVRSRASGKQDSGILGSGNVVGHEGEDTEIWKQQFNSGHGPWDNSQSLAVSAAGLMHKQVLGTLRPGSFAILLAGAPYVPYMSTSLSTD